MSNPLSSLGVGVFESFKARIQGSECAVVALDKHLERLEIGAKELEIPIPASLTKDTVVQEIGNRLSSFASAGEYHCRLVLTPVGVLFEANPFVRRLPIEGAILWPVTMQRPLPHLKTTSTIVSFVAQQEARRHGAHEALLLSHNDVPSECSWSNLFWFNQHGTLFTPASNLLAGITRALVLQTAGLEAQVVDVPFQVLVAECKEAFMTSSLHGITPVRAIGEKLLETSHHTWTLQRKLDTLSAPLITQFTFRS